MKSYIIALIVALTMLLGNSQTTSATPHRVKGSGKLITKEIALQPFKTVKVSRGINAHLVTSDSSNITIEADDNLMEYIVAHVEKGCLILTINSSIQSLSSTHVTITVPTDGVLYGITATSAAKVECQPQIVAGEVDLSATSAAKIKAKVKAEECDIELSSSAEIEVELRCNECSIEGTSAAELTATIAARECNIELSSAAQATIKGASLQADAECTSASKLNAVNFAVKRYEIEVSSAASANICCVETLDAEASSGGSIRYKGECRNTTRSSSGGSIRPL